jgi:hypothetical protein
MLVTREVSRRQQVVLWSVASDGRIGEVAAIGWPNGARQNGAPPAVGLRVIVD